MTDNNGYPVNFFRTNEIMHCISGLWLFNNKAISIRRRCLQYLWTVLVYLFTVWIFVLECMMLRETVKDVKKFITQFGLLMCHILGILKVLVLVIRHEKFEELVDTLQDKKYQYEAVGEFNPGQRLCEAQKLGSRFSIFLWLMYTCVGVSAHISSEAIINKEVKGKYFEGNQTCYDYMPYYFVIPFTVDTKVQCEYTLLFLDYSMDTYAWFIACHDGFYVALLIYLKNQLDILGDAIRRIRPRILKRLNLPINFRVFYDDEYPTLEEALYNEFTHLTKHLIILLRVADDLEAIFNLIILAQAATSLIVFASCLFVATSIPVNSPEFFAQEEYFSCMLIQLSTFCWFGSGITRASEGIMFAIYDCDWLGASRRFKISMLTTMCRMQKPIYLTIGKFFPLTLNAIVMVCKASFSYYTVFKSVGE